MDRMQFVKAAHDYYAVAIVYYFLDKDRSQATPTRVVDTLTEEWGLVKRISDYASSSATSRPG